MSADAPPTIKLGDYLILKRQKYTKLQKFGALDTVAILGKELLELREICDKPYYSTFKITPKDGPKNKQRTSTLELCSEKDMRDIRAVLGISSSGTDNRNIIDDGESQTLGPDDIVKLREECNESSKIIEKIVENSKTFTSKTEYSQQKYLKKKEKKYFEYVQIRQPTIRLLTEIFYRQDPEKIMGIRMDTLSQIISYSGVCGFGNYLMYESGTNGLLPASFLNSMGSNTDATLVHMHPGNVSQKQAVVALNLPEEQRNRCISVNIYSVLRQFHQGENTTTDQNTNNSGDEKLVKTVEENDDSIKEVVDEPPSCKKPRLEDTEDVNNTSSSTEKRPFKWQLENKRACKLMTDKFDSLVIAAKEHPANIFKALQPFIKPSRPIVIFSLCKEVLMEMYVEFKASTEITNLHLTSNWLRMYQILPNRTHPEVTMNGNSGYLLCGYTLS